MVASMALVFAVNFCFVNLGGPIVHEGHWFSPEVLTLGLGVIPLKNVKIFIEV